MIIIHGEDTVTSYKKLSDYIELAKKESIDNIIKDASEIDPTSLRQEMSGNGLFGSEKQIIIKNLLSGSKNKNKEQLIEILSHDQSAKVILFESKKIPETSLKKFSLAKKELQSINPVIFKFLDLLRPGNSRNILAGWNRLVELNHEPEYVFIMIVRQIRLLIEAKSGPSYLKLAPYPKKLIVAQAEYFDLTHLLDLHHILFEIDRKIKTGTSTLPIDQLLLQFLLKI